jgi:hypothetical protein
VAALSNPNDPNSQPGSPSSYPVDTDNDSFSDLEEARAGTDPNNPNSHPGPARSNWKAETTIMRGSVNLGAGIPWDSGVAVTATLHWFGSGGDSGSLPLIVTYENPIVSMFFFLVIEPGTIYDFSLSWSVPPTSPESPCYADVYFHYTYETSEGAPWPLDIPADNDPGFMYYGSDGEFTSVSWKVALPKVELVTPSGNPVSAPDDDGDGQNEFTFTAEPDNKLEVKFKVRVTPNTDEVLNALQERLYCFMDFVGTEPSWDIPDPNRTYCGLAHPEDGFLVATATFNGLPAENSAFGKKYAEVAGYGLTSTFFEVFFPRDAKNHPGDGTGTTPNWYHYWSGTAVPVDYRADPKFEYNGAVPGGRFDKATGKIYLGPNMPGHLAYTGVSTRNGGRSYRMDYSGIDNVLVTLIHEGEHANIHAMWQDPDLWKDKPNSDVNDPIPDEVEKATAGFDWRASRSFTYRPLTPGAGFDDEPWCDLKALHYLSLGVKADETQDWANPGKQSKSRN